MNRNESKKPRGKLAGSPAEAARNRRRAQLERRGDPEPRAGEDAPASVGRRGDVSGAAPAASERRRMSRFLWAACEELLAAAAEPRSLNRALDKLRAAFECDGVALHAVGPSGALEPWSARGAWRTGVGDLRGCMSVPLFRGDERVGTLDLLAAPGRGWRPAQLSLIRVAAGTLGAAIGARIELQRLRNLPGRDALTGLPDGKAFQTRLAEELVRAHRHAVPVGVVAIDIDHLTEVNKRYGREAGDDVLSEAALMLKLVLRESDVIARWTEDTFVVMLPETDRESSLRCADRVSRAFEEHRFARVGRLTISAGVAACPPDGTQAIELVEAAERALTIAKKAGRRRVGAAAPPAVH